MDVNCRTQLMWGIQTLMQVSAGVIWGPAHFSSRSFPHSAFKIWAWNMLNKSKRRWHSSRRCSPKTAANFNCECEKNEYNMCYKIFGRHDQGWMSIAGIEFNYWVQKKGFMKLFWSLKNDSYIFYIYIYIYIYKLNIYIYIYTHTHTHSLATLLGTLVPGWTPFCLQNYLNSSRHRFNKVLETFLRDFGHIDMIASRSYCRFVGCTSMMRISRSTTSQRCSIGLRSGDCGGHLSKVNSFSCSRNQSEMIWALWHGALSCWK